MATLPSVVAILAERGGASHRKRYRDIFAGVGVIYFTLFIAV
jgi:hypothetical protein